MPVQERVYRFVCLLLLLLGPLSPLFAQEAATTPEEIWRQIEAAPRRGLLYEIKDGEHTAYIFGTIHVGTPEFYPLNLPVTRALTTAKYLAVEADILDAAAVTKHVTELAMYPGSSSLDRHVPPALLRRIVPLLEKYNFPEEEAMRLKPWMLAMTLSVLEAARAGYHPNWSVEVYLLAFARGQQKPVVELEGLAQQFRIFNDLTPERQLAFLEDTLRSLEEGEARKEISALVDAWTKADAAGLENEWKRLQRDRSASEKFIADRLLGGRNSSMAARVDEYLRSGETYFVAMGVLHLVGEGNVIELLKRRGYRIREL